MSKDTASEVSLLNGQMPSESITRENGASSSLPCANIPEDISEAIDPDWITQLLHEYHPDYDGKVFVVKMTSRWGSTKPVFFLPSDLYDKKSLNKLTNELVNRGRFIPDEADALIKYVDYMKVAGPGMITPDDGSYKQHIMQTTDLSDEVDSEECYRQIVEYILDNGSVFPSQENNGFDDKWCHGAYLDSDKSIKKFGENAYAFVPSHLQSLLDIPNRKLFGAVLDELVKQGRLYSGGGKNPRKDIVVPLSIMVSKKVYVFTIDPSVLMKGVESNEQN